MDSFPMAFPEAGLCRAPPRDVRGLVIPGEPAQSLLQQRKQLSVNTTFNYQLQLAVSTTTRTRRQTINIKKDADRSRLMIISKFCQLSTLKSGFFLTYSATYMSSSTYL